MKIIHCADIHLGSALESKFPREKTEIRKREVLSSFKRMIDYAHENEVRIILLSGDVFDADRPTKRDRDYFYNEVRNNPDIDFIYLCGNHDKDGALFNEEIPNLKRFSKNDLIKYSYDNIDISGIEITDENYRTFYSNINLEKNKINIVLLHGDLTNSVGIDKIKINNLINKNIDYLALGHIHSYKHGEIDKRGIYAYPGCLEGRGFDECGDKGFILINIENGIISHDFIKFASRTINELKIDVSNAETFNNVVDIVIKNTRIFDDKDILRIILTGMLPEEIVVDIDYIKSCLNRFFFVYIKNEIKTKIDLSQYDNNSLIGILVRNINNSEYDEDTKNELFALCRKVINNDEVI